MPLPDQMIHVEKAHGLKPVFVHFDGQCTPQPQATSGFEKILPTWVRRLISWFNRSSMFVDFMCLVSDALFTGWRRRPRA